MFNKILLTLLVPNHPRLFCYAKYIFVHCQHSGASFVLLLATSPMSHYLSTSYISNSVLPVVTLTANATLYIPLAPRLALRSSYSHVTMFNISMGTQGGQVLLQEIILFIVIHMFIYICYFSPDCLVGIGIMDWFCAHVYLHVYCPTRTVQCVTLEHGVLTISLVTS